MLENNAGKFNDQNDDENINSSLGNDEVNQQNSSSDNNEMGETQESASQDDDETKKQSATNVADKNRNIASSYHDNQRVTSRANEANDRLDSGSGGLSSGGVKSATDY